MLFSSGFPSGPPIIAVVFSHPGTMVTVGHPSALVGGEKPEAGNT